jgi:hypothetical protein
MLFAAAATRLLAAAVLSALTWLLIVWAMQT